MKYLSKAKIIEQKSNLLLNHEEIEEIICNYLNYEAKLNTLKQLDFYMCCEMLISKGTYLGRIMNLININMHLCSWFIFVGFTFYQMNINYLNGDCYLGLMNMIKWLDFGINLFCALHFTLRIIVQNNFEKFWLDFKNIIDICVIPNILLTTFLNVRRQGFSFIRIMYLQEICDSIIILLSFHKINYKFEITKLLFHIISVLLIAGGCYQIAEGIGNFWESPVLNQPLNLWVSTYLIMITIATIGYGDETPITVLGQIIICIYIIYGVSVFINYTTQVIAEMRNKNYNAKYITRIGERHILVSGKFNNFTMVSFLRSFKKQNPKFKDVNIIIMDSQSCDSNLSIYLNKFSWSIKYFVGSFQFHKDFEPICMNQVKIAVILALPITENAHRDDIDNIMNAISLKVEGEKIRTIVQLHLYSNKILLKMFPKWNKYGQDIILCIDELKLGLMAYNCLAPGISTLITNLISRTSKIESQDLWQENYEEGVQNGLYSVHFSNFFEGLLCLEVALILYEKLDVSLVAIKYSGDFGSYFVTINPMTDNLNINTTTMIAIVMARDEMSAQSVSKYYSNIMKNESNDLYIDKVNSSDDLIRNNFPIPIDSRLSINSSTSDNDFFVIDSTIENQDINDDIHVDETGSFYWTTEPKFEDVCLDIEEAESMNLSHHILVCICQSGDESIDLCNFMMPLRSLALLNDDLQTIVFLGNKRNFEGNKFNNMKNFPMFLMINGSPIQARNLRAAGLYRCDACVIINGNDSSTKMSDKNSIICTTLIESMIEHHELNLSIITEIRNDENVYFSCSINSQNYDDNVSVQHSEPFAIGKIFTNSVLYSCIYTIYNNPDTFLFVKTIICGPNSEKVERMFGSGVGLLPHKRKLFNKDKVNPIIKLLSIKETPFDLLINLYKLKTITYEILYKWALIEKRILCLGIYRLNSNKNRYVFTHPNKSTNLQMTDQIYCCFSNYQN